MGLPVQRPEAGRYDPVRSTSLAPPPSAACRRIMPISRRCSCARNGNRWRSDRLTDACSCTDANPWYRSAYDAALITTVADGLNLKHLSAAYFLATKFEAFRDRGRNDVYLSHDLEDILTVIEGRASIAADVAAAPPDVKSHVSSSVRRLLAHPHLRNALPGLLSEPGRESAVLARLNQLSRLSTRTKIARHHADHPPQRDAPC